MDIAGILAAAAGLAAVAKAAKKKRTRSGSSSDGGSRSRRASGLSARLGTQLLTREVGGMSLSELLSGRLLVRDTHATGSGTSAAGTRGSGSRGRGTRGSGRSRGSGHRGGGVASRSVRRSGGAVSSSPVRRRPDRADLEREGVPHPLIVKRRRDRRREFLREVANVSMGAAAIGVSTAGLLFDAGAAPDWFLGGGALAAVVFGWILGRGVLSDLVHLGA
jgi:hypothetical protein